jgi:hypothetical protein
MSQILDSAIAIILIFLIFSLLVSAAHEVISSLLKLRGRNLSTGVTNLLSRAGAGQFAEHFYRHQLIKSLSKEGQKPSYIPSRTFALAVLDMVSPVQPGKVRTLNDITSAIANLSKHPDLQKTLTILLEESGYDVDAFKTNIEIWFNNGMDRVSGWYKRQTQYILLAIAAVLTFALNMDSVAIWKAISTDSTLRATLVESAKELKQPEKPAPGASADALERFNTDMATYQSRLQDLQKLQQAGLPLGWTDEEWNAEPITKIRRHLLGWLLTALAASLGAPFWFDLLNRFVNVRGVGKAPEEDPKKPKEVPQAAAPGAPAGVLLG